MGHTAPDWSSFGKLATIFPVFDMGELAVRLGSIVSHDRRGNVVWLDSFEAGLAGWVGVPYGDSAALSLSVAEVRSGGYAAKLVPGTNGDKAYRILRRLPYPSLSKYGLEASIRLDEDLHTVLISLGVYDGVYLTTYTLLYHYTNKILYVYDSTPEYDSIATGLDLEALGNLFHTFKLVVDIESRAYVRAIVNEVEYDLTAYSGYPDLDDTEPRLDASVQVNQDGAVTTFGYVDDVIITQNEE